MRYALNATPINGGARLYGKSTALLITVNASGFSTKQKHAQSTVALIDIAGAGALKKALSAISTAEFSLGGIAFGRLGRRGQSNEAGFVLGARHGIPNPMPRSPKVGPAHRSRVIMVQPDSRVVIVPSEDREV